MVKEPLTFGGSHQEERILGIAMGPHHRWRTFSSLGGGLAIVKRRKLQWYGHASHSAGLAKTIL